MSKLILLNTNGAKRDPSPAEMMNKQMDFFDATLSEMKTIHSSLMKIADYQKAHCDALCELANLLGIKVLNEEKK